MIFSLNCHLFLKSGPYSIFEYLEENKLLCPNQSRFRPSDSCEYKLLSLLHEIYKYFDCNPPKDGMGIFLYLSKAFSRV